MKRATSLLIVIFLSAGALKAQVNSSQGRFQVDQAAGCIGSSGFTVTITLNPPSTCSSCEMFFGDVPGSQNNTFTHTYTAPGIYTLTIFFGYSLDPVNNPQNQSDNIQIRISPNTPPQFELYACSGNDVSVNITDTNYPQYVINFNDASPEVTWAPGQPRRIHSYATSGSKTVSVRGRNNGGIDNCSPATQSVNATATLPAAVISQLRVVDNTSIELTYNTPPGVLYRLEIATNGATTFQLLKTVYNTTSETISNLQPDNHYYCFRLVPSDPCNNVPPTAAQYSNVICSANFDLSIQNNSNNLTWTTSTAGNPTLRITRTTQGSSLSYNVTGTSEQDTNIQCGTNYCYQLTSNYAGGIQSISLQKCGTAISTDAPPPVENISLVVNEGGLAIQWEPVAGVTAFAYSVFKSEGAVYNVIDTTVVLQITDPTYTAQSAACYKISYTDICANASPLSAEACPIVLTGTLSADNSVNLSWTAYTGWRNGVANYMVDKYDGESGQLLQTFDAGVNLSLTDTEQDLDNQVYIYVVRAIPVTIGVLEAVSNTVIIIKNPNLFYPTAFTPNGDNLNDIFNVYGQYIVAFEMNIFNRWGELLYTTTELDQGWNGYFKGNLMPEGTYAFVADIRDRAGRTFKKSGSVMLLRKR